ncbi:DUF6338 family protein [Curtobacterium sp. L1-20]|uniref:DUF6338 family protein n=1 Tax=Curtobacterium sp. L1-20 TaxID=3138181 RepID=UPI003B52C9F6
MIPTTFAGLAVLVVALLPGFVFVSLRDRQGPSRTRAAFRETSVVLAVSAASYVLPAVGLALVAVTNADARAQLEAFLREPVAAWQDRPLLVFAVVVLAIVLAAAVAGVGALISRHDSRHDPTASAWWNVFSANDKGDAAVRRVSVHLTDGTLIVGNLNSFSREVAEHGDRELVLQHPMWVQPEGAEDLIEMQAAATLISARNIKFISVELFNEGAEPDQEPESDEEAAP